MSAAIIIRLCAALGVTALLAAPAACSPRSDVPDGVTCQQISWGGWDGTPHCAGVSAVVIGGPDRACAQHSDCVLVGVNRCTAHTVNQAALGRFQQFPPPCDHPLSTMCPPSPRFAVCVQGCCAPSQTPPPPGPAMPPPMP